MGVTKFSYIFPQSWVMVTWELGRKSSYMSLTVESTHSQENLKTKGQGGMCWSREKKLCVTMKAIHIKEVSLLGSWTYSVF